MEKRYYFIPPKDMAKLDALQRYLQEVDCAHQYVNLICKKLQGESYERREGLWGLVGGAGELFYHLSEHNKSSATILVKKYKSKIFSKIDKDSKISFIRNMSTHMAKIDLNFLKDCNTFSIRCSDSIPKPLLDEILENITPIGYTISDKMPRAD